MFVTLVKDKHKTDLKLLKIRIFLLGENIFNKSPGVEKISLLLCL